MKEIFLVFCILGQEKTLLAVNIIKEAKYRGRKTSCHDHLEKVSTVGLVIIQDFRLDDEAHNYLDHFCNFVDLP